jgi:signal transduction histidine kinase
MLGLSGYRFIKELCDNIAIIDSNYTLLYNGELFNKSLTGYGINLSCLSSSISNFASEFYTQVKKTNSNNQPAFVSIPETDNRIIIVPSANNDIFIIGFEEHFKWIINIEHQLKERVKELTCLYEITNALDKFEKIQEVFENCTEITRLAFQDPDETFVIIEIGNNKYGSRCLPSAETHDQLCSEINVGNENKGKICVFTKKKIGFLVEEQKLLNEIAGKISTLIEKEERKHYLEKQQKILTAKNDVLMKLTEECHQKRENLNTFFKAITDKIYVIDSDYNIVMSNKDEVGESGKCYSKIFNRQSQCFECPAVESFINGNNTFKDVEDSGRYYMLRAYPIAGSDGRTERVLEVCRDITSQKYLEAQLIQSYKLASLGKLVAGVAHEINNPNTFILGNLKIVQEAFEDIFPILDNHFYKNNNLNIARLDYKTFKENISILITDMINGANRTKKIVADLRNFAKKDDGSLVEDVDLNYIIKNNLTLTQKQIKKYAELQIELCSFLPTFKGSVNKIEQVLLNMTMNAAEATAPGKGIVKVITNFDKTANEILLKIIDNGIGMSEAVIKNIFDPFFTTKRDKGGTGLGLSISYGIIKELSGRIEVESKLGSGTTFTIHIPVKS